MLKIKNYLFAWKNKLRPVFSIHGCIKFLFSIVIICCCYLLLLQVKVITQISAQGSASFFTATEQDTLVDVESNMQKGQEGTININTASKEELMQLPNIGAKKAEEIMQYRMVTPFDDPTELQEVKGIGVKTYEQLADLITV